MGQRKNRVTRKRTQRKRKTLFRQRGGAIIDCSTITPHFFEVKPPARYGSYPGSVAYAGIPEVITLVEKYKAELELGKNENFLNEYRTLEPSIWASEVKDSGGRKLENFRDGAPMGGVVRTISDYLNPLAHALFTACKTINQEKEAREAREAKAAANVAKMRAYISTATTKRELNYPPKNIVPRGPHGTRDRRYRQLVHEHQLKLKAAEENKKRNLLGLYSDEENLLTFPSNMDKRVAEMSGLFNVNHSSSGAASGGAGTS